MAKSLIGLMVIDAYVPIGHLVFKMLMHGFNRCSKTCE